MHNIVNLPNSIEKLLQTGEERTFNFFKSMYRLNIRIEAENGLAAAFQFWNLPKVVTRLDEVMEDFLYNLTDYARNPKVATADFTSNGVITMLKAICNVQRTILTSPRGIVDKEEFNICGVLKNNDEMRS